MLFSSTEFLLAFFPIVLIGYFLVLKKSRKAQNVFLCIASLLFYAWGEPKFVFVMLASIFINWAMGIFISKNTEKVKISRFFVALAVVANMGLLFVFKYVAFTLMNINNIFGSGFFVPSIVLPIGISFFTFQGLSYVIDVYRQKGKVQKNFLNVALYVSFFPQLIAGPIVRYETVANEIDNRHENWADFTYGVERFILGLSKKLLLADKLAVLSDQYFTIVNGGTGASVVGLWAGAIAYTLQIYFDFSGYSDMAIGLGRMFGFHFNENFNQPYLAGSITDFWRRWHISLSTWFRDYVYIPLGGNRVKSTARLVFNLFVVWLCTGLWHGANWTFIIWGLGYFVLLCIEKFTHITDTKIFKKLGHFYTMFFVVMGWVLFRSEDINIAGNYFKGMFGFAGLQFVNELNLYDLRHYGVYFIIALLAVTPLVNLLKKKNDAVQISAKKNFGKSICLMILFILCLSCAISNVYSPFIYFNF